MKIEHLFLFIIYLLSYQTSLCQQNSIDSLERLLPQTTKVDDKVVLYEALIVKYEEKDPNKVVQYSNQILKLLTENAYETKGNVYNYLGLAYKQLVQHDKAIACFDSALYCFEFSNSKEKISATTENKWRAYRYLTVKNLYKDPDKAMKYAEILLELAPNSNNPDHMAMSYSLIGSIHSIRHQAERSFEYFDSAIYYYKKTDNQREIARMYNFKGTAYYILVQYKDASKWLYKSLETYDSLNLPSKTASTLDALASIDMYFKDYPAAIKKRSKAIDIHTNINNNPTGAAISNLNMGNIYIATKEWDKAIPYLNKAISLFIELNEYGNLIRAYLLQTDALEKNGQLKLAQQSIEKAIELKEHAYNQDDLLKIYAKQAALFFVVKDYSKSIASFSMLLDSAEKSSNIYLQIEVLKGLMRNYTVTNNFKKAFDCSTKLLIVNDSLIAQNNQKNIKDIEIKYNTEKKEQENQLLLKEKELQAKDVLRNQQLFYLSIGFAFLILIISILVLRQYKLTARATNNQLKSRLLRNQMSPHFLFNSLVAIQSFVYTNKPIKAGDYLSSFASLMRAILDNSSQEYITIEKELQWLENYLSLQLLRFSHKFEYHIDLDQNIQVDDVLIPPMLIQPFIENALEHGLKKLDKKGLLSIRIQHLGKELLIEVEDNGIGMSNTVSDSYKKHQSRALTITKERLTFLNKKQAQKIDFDIKSSTNNGTLVSFRIPFKSKF